jgi:hypothetical protein
MGEVYLAPVRQRYNDGLRGFVSGERCSVSHGLPAHSNGASKGKQPAETKPSFARSKRPTEEEQGHNRGMGLASATVLESGLLFL